MIPFLLCWFATKGTEGRHRAVYLVPQIISPRTFNAFGPAQVYHWFIGRLRFLSPFMRTLSPSRALSMQLWWNELCRLTFRNEARRESLHFLDFHCAQRLLMGILFDRHLGIHWITAKHFTFSRFFPFTIFFEKKHWSRWAFFNLNRLQYLLGLREVLWLIGVENYREFRVIFGFLPLRCYSSKD